MSKIEEAEGERRQQQIAKMQKKKKFGKWKTEKDFEHMMSSPSFQEKMWGWNTWTI